MKTKLHHVTIFPVLLFLIGFGINSFAQDNRQNTGLEINSKLINAEGEPIRNGKIVLGDGLVTTYTDAAGGFYLTTTSNNILLITANGYKDHVIDLATTPVGDEIVLTEGLLFNSDIYTLSLPNNLSTTRRKSVAAIDEIKGSDLESQPGLVFSNSWQGRLAGLSVRMTTNGLGNNQPQLFIRGLAREGNNEAITIVDGVERRIDFLNAEEIESVEVLKDASSKILYGSRAANGVILITTKRGKANTQVVKASAEYGVVMNTRMPNYLNSAQYAELYNEARTNDGLNPFYSQEQIEGYRQSSGENDLQYPDVDYNEYFIKDFSPFRKANFEYSGGAKGVQHAILLGYAGTEGIEKIGRSVTLDRINVRSNLNIEITPSLTGYLDGNGIIEGRNWGKLGQNQVFEAISSQRPNEFPFIIMDPDFQGDETPLGAEQIPPLGGSMENPNSLYGNMKYGGFQEHQYFYGQTNFGLDLDMGKVIEGLSANTTMTFDSYQFHAADQINNPIRYATQIVQGSNGADSLTYIKLNNRVINGNRSERGDNLVRNLGWSSNLKYENSFDMHEVSLTLGHFYYLNEVRGNRQKGENTNTFLRSTYAFKDKLYLDWTQTIMGSNRFAEGNRYKYFGALGAAWIISEENFLRGSNIVNFLKLKASYGILGYDGATSYYLFETRYSDSGNVNFGERNQGGARRTGFSNFGNPNLKWETSKEYNVGIEGLTFNNSLMFSLNYFNELRSDIIFNDPGALYSSLNGDLNTPLNLGEVTNSGIDGSITYFGGAGDFRYHLGGNFLFVKNKVNRTNAVNNPNAYFNQTGNSSDAIFGYVSNGIFRTQEEIDNAPFQSFGPYQVGNIQYQDLNGDGVITEQDQQVIGNSFPEVTLGINFNIKYKGFGLDLLGTSELGVDFIKNNAYYRNAGEGKYSSLAQDRFHPVNNPNGSQPVLTTRSATNDFRNSSFWIEDASFLRLKNAEVSYTLSKDTRIAKTIKFHVRGTNLLVISNVKDLDPEVPNSGVENYPLFRTITGGVTVGF